MKTIIETKNEYCYESDVMQEFKALENDGNADQNQLVVGNTRKWVYLLSGDIMIDLRWVMDNQNEGELNYRWQYLNQVGRTHEFHNMKGCLLAEIDNRENLLQNFQFLYQEMIQTFSTPQALQLGTLLAQYEASLLSSSTIASKIVPSDNYPHQSYNEKAIFDLYEKEYPNQNSEIIQQEIRVEKQEEELLDKQVESLFEMNKLDQNENRCGGYFQKVENNDNRSDGGYPSENYNQLIMHTTIEEEYQRNRHSQQKDNMEKRREITLVKAKQILSELNENDHWMGELFVEDEKGLTRMCAQSQSKQLLEILGISVDQMSHLQLRRGSTVFFDWKTRLAITLARLQTIIRYGNQFEWTEFEANILTFDGFMVKAHVSNQYIIIPRLQMSNEMMTPPFFPSNPSSSSQDYLCVMRFTFEPMLNKQLIHFRRGGHLSNEMRLSLLPPEMTDSIGSSYFLEKYYVLEIQQLGYKRKKIRKTKAKALEEITYFKQLQKNKYLLSRSTLDISEEQSAAQQ